MYADDSLPVLYEKYRDYFDKDTQEGLMVLTMEDGAILTATDQLLPEHPRRLENAIGGDLGPDNTYKLYKYLEQQIQTFHVDVQASVQNFVGLLRIQTLLQSPAQQNMGHWHKILPTPQEGSANTDEAIQDGSESDFNDDIQLDFTT
ncbi:hypothetical protein HDU87_006221 [Geranomyces variabilis]|uniref:Uncharacterized protein n=1 Tax=Geranomyces variabilis TaxID=109894 RepID=A0AAD5XL78_9FUNG|nr:hypothetical protein HDU87_006221 [Geranomyces variabilis]